MFEIGVSNDTMIIYDVIVIIFQLIEAETK